MVVITKPIQTNVVTYGTLKFLCCNDLVILALLVTLS